MASKRLKYFKQTDGTYKTDNIKNIDNYPLVAGHSADGKSGYIKSVGDETINIELTATSLHKIKIKIKKALIRLGCRFDTEERIKRLETRQ